MATVNRPINHLFFLLHDRFLAVLSGVNNDINVKSFEMSSL